MILSSANKVWDILVARCGATESGRSDFRNTILMNESDRLEYRFQGNLGFGGKLWINPYQVYVTCYPEDRTPDRAGAIEAANAELEALFPRYHETTP